VSTAIDLSVPRHWSWRALFATTDDRVALVLRVVFAGVLWPHGGQHALGWFGGYGFSGTYGWMTGTLGVPGPLAALAIVTELVAPPFLLVGFGGRVAAAGLGTVLAVAATTHAANGFFMNWSGHQPGEGFEYHLLGVAIAVALVVRGSGALSVDRRLVQ
jgi:putative oxidoreductase